MFGKCGRKSNHGARFRSNCWRVGRKVEWESPVFGVTTGVIALPPTNGKVLIDPNEVTGEPCFVPLSLADAYRGNDGSRGVRGGIGRRSVNFVNFVNIYQWRMRGRTPQKHGTSESSHSSQCSHMGPRREGFECTCVSAELYRATGRRVPRLESADFGDATRTSKRYMSRRDEDGHA